MYSGDDEGFKLEEIKDLGESSLPVPSYWEFNSALDQLIPAPTPPPPPPPK